MNQARTRQCDFDQIFELQSLSKTVSIVNQVRKLQNQYLHNNTGDGTLPQAIHCGTPRLELVELIIIFKVIFFLLQLVLFTVDSDPL